MKEILYGIFIITAPISATATSEQDAYRAAAEASYKQSGLENMVNIFVERELRFIPKPIQTVVSNAYLVGKAIQERKVVYTWSF